MKHFVLGLAATAASAVLAGGAAQAGDTTIIHDYKQVTPAPAADAQTSRETTQATVQRTVTHHAVYHRRLVHHVTHRSVAIHHTVAQNAGATAVDTSAVRDQTTQTTTSAAAPAASPTVVERRTVIHRNDNGDVDTHTRVIRQDSNGMTTVEHHSTETDSGE